MAIIYDKSMILESIVTWINDITLVETNHKFVYAGDDVNSNLGEPSKSYMQGQFYYDTIRGVVYVSLTLDPNTNWGYKYNGLDVLMKVIDHIHESPKKGLLEDIKVEFVLPHKSLLENHEARSKCRTEDCNNYLYSDTMFLWKNVNGSYMFLRDNALQIENQYKLVCKIGSHQARDNISQYRQQVELLNRDYPGTIDSNMVTAFNRYKTIFSNFFTSVDSTIRQPYIIPDSDIEKFYLLNWTDYSIIKYPREKEEKEED